MAAILELDLDNHVAVVQPGVTLDQLDEATAQVGLVYPVFPGESSASLGGNVATNAGGMRAIKYGVTRHQVLGLEAVTGTGELIRTGGRFVKSSSAYDLTQLIVGSEGTLALVTEATLRLYPRPPWAATVLAPFPTLAEATGATPTIVGSGIGPLLVEYIDLLAMGGIVAHAGLDLGVEASVRDQAQAWLVVVIEQRREDRLAEDVEELAVLLAELGALDVYVLPAHAGTQLIEAREKAFWAAKAAGADDIVDVVVPRSAMAAYIGRVNAMATATGSLVTGCGHVGDGNVHLSVFQPDAEVRHGLVHDMIATGVEMGGAVSGEHGLGTEKREVFLELADPAQLVLMRRIKDAFDPARHPQPGGGAMNGAQALIRALTELGVDVAFMNPGTSEMHFVAALDAVPEMRGVLALFEGVATGAADGYGRMAEHPAATLLHLGPGLGNGLANLHNARRAHTPVVNIVGDHATYHKAYDPQLESDIETVARNVSSFVRRAERPDDVVADALSRGGRRARSARPGGHADPAGRRLVVGGGRRPERGTSRRPAGRPRRMAVEPAVDADRVEAVAAVLRSGETGRPVRGRAGGAGPGPARTLAAVSAATGAQLLCETFPARLERGAGVPPVERLGYLAEFAAAQLDGLAHLVLVDAPSPVSFFAYPGQGQRPGPRRVRGARAGRTGRRRAGARWPRWWPPSTRPGPRVPAQAPGRPELPTGALTAETVCAALGALLPEGAIVSDEGNTSGLFAAGTTAGAPPHDWLCLTGGAIGQGLPVAVGAAVACPDRRVIAFESDGSALYTFQSLWTMAREGLDVTTIILNNRSYAVLNMELDRVGAEPAGPRARRMLDLAAARPRLRGAGQGPGSAGHPGHHRRGVRRPAAVGPWPPRAPP